MDHLCLCVMFCSCFRVRSLLPCGHLLGRDDLLTLAGDVYCIFVAFPYCILGQVWYLIVSFPDLCRLSYFDTNPCSQRYFFGLNIIQKEVFA